MTYPKRGIYVRNNPAEYVWVGASPRSSFTFLVRPRVLYRVLWSSDPSPGHEACLVSLDAFQREFVLVHAYEEGPGEIYARVQAAPAKRRPDLVISMRSGDRDIGSMRFDVLQLIRQRRGTGPDFTEYLQRLLVNLEPRVLTTLMELMNEHEKEPQEADAQERSAGTESVVIPYEEFKVQDEPDWKKAYAELRALVVQDVPLEEGLTKHQGRLVKHLTRYPAPEKS